MAEQKATTPTPAAQLRRALFEWQELKRRINAAHEAMATVKAEKLEQCEHAALVAIAEAAQDLLQELYVPRSALRTAVDREERNGAQTIAGHERLLHNAKRLLGVVE